MESKNSSMRLILASASPRRADLLRAAGFQFETCAADVDESVRANESPAEYVQRLASEKSAAVAAALRCSAGLPPPRAARRRASPKRSEGGKACPTDVIVILMADTTVVL